MRSVSRFEVGKSLLQIGFLEGRVGPDKACTMGVNTWQSTSSLQTC